MPNLAFFGFPLRGHTAPSLALVAALTRRGARVDYYSLPAFKPLVESVGGRFIPYRGGCEALLTSPVDSSEHLARNLAVADTLLPLLLAEMTPAPALVLFDASAIWGGILARRLGLPSVCSVTTFAFNRQLLKLLNAPLPAAWSQPTFERLNLAYDAKLQDHLDLLAPAADLKVIYTSRAFQPAGRFLDDRHLFVGPLVDERPRDGARAEATGQRPMAYVSLGTLFNRDLAMLLQISQVLVERGWQVIVSLGDAAATTGSWPEHVQAYPFVDQIGVLAQAQLFVTHGGMNSVSEALSQAVPMIVVPQAVDQHLVAKQAANLGAAVVIERDAVSAESLSAALATVERDRQAFGAAATRLRSSFAEGTPLVEVVDRVLALADPSHG